MKLCSALAVSILLSGCGSAWGTVREAAGANPSRLPLVKVWLDGQGPFVFTVDTGSNGCVLRGSVAKKLKLPVGREGTLRGGGGTLQSHRVLIHTVEVAGVRVDSVPFAMADLPADLGDGLLGNNFLQAYRVTLDFPRSQVRLDP